MGFCDGGGEREGLDEVLSFVWFCIRKCWGERNGVELEVR